MPRLNLLWMRTSRQRRTYLLAERMQEMVMTQFQALLISRLAIAASILVSAGSALAAQGPGVESGTASQTTQLVMAILVYGASAAIIGAGLIGALRGHCALSAAAPVAAHMRRDHGAARPVLLHIGDVAFADRIGARIVTRIDAIRRVIGRDAQAGLGPPAWRRHVVRRHRLGHTDDSASRLRLGAHAN